MRRPMPVDGDPNVADQPFKIVGIAGSLRRASWNRGLLRAAVEGAPDGIEIVTLDLDLVPLYNQDVEDAGEPSGVVALKDVIRLADALLIATPEYNNGMPGVLKNAIDWASRPARASVLRDKPVVVIGVSPGAGAAARAQQQVRDALIYTGGCVMPEPELLVGAAIGKFDDAGNVIDPALRAQVVDMVTALRDWAERIRLPQARAA
jgi:chromate reductase, NAD(P)H dehydrogenase (quinone)